jgi:hypothetical protein
LDQFIYLPFISRAPTPSNNLPVWTATYLGGSSADEANAVDVAPDGTVVLGGVMPGHNPGGVTPVELLGGGDGVVVRLDASGQSVLSITRIGGRVEDLEVDAEGRIGVCGDFGVALLNASADSLVWSADPGNGSRCAVGSDGTLAAIVGSSAYVYDVGGSPHGNWSIGGSDQSDVAVYTPGGLVIATGYTQKSSNLQVAFIRAWTYSGSASWTSYDFSAAAVDGQGLGADTRGRRVAVGRDGWLYFAGTSNGGTGASIFSRDPHDVTLRLGSDRYITADFYTNPYNVGSKTLTWYGRYDPLDGDLLRGQPLLTRLSSGSGNSIRPWGITADEDGYVYLVGDAWATLENRDARQIAGTTVGPYSSGEAFLMIVRPDLSERLIWTPFAGSPNGAGGSPARAVSARSGTAALTITLSDEGSLIPYNALQATPSTLDDGYLAVWRAYGR